MAEETRSVGRYRAALIGCGRKSRYHIQALLVTPGVQFVALADPYRPALDRRGNHFGIPAAQGAIAEMVVMLKVLLTAVEGSRQHPSSGRDARGLLEMILGAFESHRRGGARTALPWPLAGIDWRNGKQTGAYQSGAGSIFDSATLATEGSGTSYLSLMLCATSGIIGIKSIGDREIYHYPRPVILPGPGHGWERIVS